MNVPIFTGEGKVHFEERKIPTPGDNQLLIQAKANLLCGSDRNQFYNGSPQCIPGHEGAGVIVDKGKNAKFDIGMKGAVYLYDYCHKCRSCQLGLTNQCLHKNCDYGFNVDGAFCEYYLVNDYVFFPVDESVDVINATLLLDVMGTGGHATKRAQLVHKDIQSVLINGAGPIGLGLLAMSKLTFAKDLPVLINDVKSSRLPLAEKMGGLPIDLSKQSLEEGVIVDKGKNAKFDIGMKGAVYLYDYCHKCRSCQLGLTNQCLHKNCDYGFNVDGAFCEYYLVNDYVFFPVDESVDVINATLLLDVMGTGGHATKRAQLVHKDIQSVLINGAGPIGLGLLAMSKLTFAKDLPVLINDVKSSRLPLAEKMGGLPIDLSKQSLEEGMEQHGIKNPDVAIDATGKAIARKNALQALAKRGVLVMVGNGEGLEFEQYPDMGGPERSILGSEYFSYNEMEANHELLKNNQEYFNYPSI